MRPPQTETVDGKENTMTDAEREMIMTIIRDEDSMANAVDNLKWRKKAVGGLPEEVDILLRTCEAVTDILGAILMMQEKSYKDKEEGNDA